MGYERTDLVIDRLELLRIYGYGLCMGAADALPGVSGGTVALLLGFYGRLIAAVTALTPRRAVAVLGGYRSDRRDRARKALVEMDLQFLLPLGVGMVTSVVLIAGTVSALADSHPIALFGFFTGLIAASAIALGRSLEFASAKHVGAAVAGATLALLVAADIVQLPGGGRAVIFFAGAIAISAMILPGISGSLILILLGQYVFLSSELSAFVRAVGDLVGGGSLAAVTDPGATIVLFVAGGLVGLVTIARIVRAALASHRELTLVFLVSLIAGSIPAPLHNIGEAHAWTTETIALTAAWALFGAIALFALEYLVGGFDPE
ncbi:DUF368 domain-containing protein [Natronorubrum sp. JWXQ-INN-674]|uniref:DUF368 domain-containing protein n=1 Tax=Natronorubrum halalkaliphilum TaxID=2691917 RepID=A0A6B0VPA0_9EURY|nr:DUF368 domain-containing protein [Natronorubrum halalkaliphilum]MXV62592.1 DUF368 domain-containing protein [Natronorubrum halalkaliphilum]